MAIRSRSFAAGAGKPEVCSVPMPARLNRARGLQFDCWIFRETASLRMGTDPGEVGGGASAT